MHIDISTVVCLDGKALYAKLPVNEEWKRRIMTYYCCLLFYSFIKQPLVRNCHLTRWINKLYCKRWKSMISYMEMMKHNPRYITSMHYSTYENWVALLLFTVTKISMVNFKINDDVQISIGHSA